MAHPVYIDPSDIMTVEELRNKLKRIRGDSKVYIVLDKDDDNWDEDNETWRQVHPIASVEKEELHDENADECNCLLHLQERFYFTYKTQPK